YGAAGLRDHIRRHIALAQDFASWVAADDRFELAAPHPLSLVCFRLRADTTTTGSSGGNGSAADSANERLLRQLNESGKIHLTHTRVNGAYTLRLATGGTWTQRRHVEDAWRLIQQAADSRTAGSSPQDGCSS